MNIKLPHPECNVTRGTDASRDANEEEQILNSDRPRDHCGFSGHVKVGI